MIRRIEALRYRCLRYVRQEIGSFQIFVGPNASGKSTFLDTVRFLGQLVSDGFEAAIRERTENLVDLFWKREGERFELAVEAGIPAELRINLRNREHDTCRYEVAIGRDPLTQEDAIFSEAFLLLTHIRNNSVQKKLFPELTSPPLSILTKVPSKGINTVINKVQKGNDNFYDETRKGWDHAFKLGTRKSALANLPEDESKFPVATWFKRSLSQGIDYLALQSSLMRKPSPPGQPRGFRPDGSNLPFVVHDFQKRNPERFERWIAHVRTALPDLKMVETVERPEDKHRYLLVAYDSGLKVPSWTVSDGTLRLLALTLLAYTGEAGRTYLIEEPENGIHPRAVETIYQSLSSAYESQILCASHSPVILSLAEPNEILCFGRTAEGATDVVRGSEHPSLRNWQRGTDLGTLFAAGVLG